MTFYFYDLETSGFNPRTARIMQFGGQRTSLDLEPIGEPSNIFIKLSEDVLLEPGAILVTGITPQKTLKEGVTEAEFLKIFHTEIATSDTIFVGFNNIRFDDEFMRFTNYRNFWDSYEWQWKNGRSRWDLLDVVRMTRALRPDGIIWPKDKEGISTNKLQDFAQLNNLNINSAHDALSDAQTTIALAKLIKNHQPKLFNFLVDLRQKKEVAKLVNLEQPFLYTSGKYPSEFEKTTIVTKLCESPERAGAIVYDLRVDPGKFADMPSEQLAEIWRRPFDDDDVVLPIKTLQYNRCPAVAPLSVLDEASEKRLVLDMDKIKANYKKLRAIKQWPNNILVALEILNKARQTELIEKEPHADVQLYDGFVGDSDRKLFQSLRKTKPEELAEFTDRFSDERLRDILPLYKARNFPDKLSSAEKNVWQDHLVKVLNSSDHGLDAYFKAIDEIGNQKGLSAGQKGLLSDLKDYGEMLKTRIS